MSLQRQIEEEMQREAAIDKKIENIKKRFLRQRSYGKYLVVYTRKESDAVLFFDRSDLTSYNILLNEEIISEYEDDPRFTMVFLKNKNPRDARTSTYGDIRKSS